MIIASCIIVSWTLTVYSLSSRSLARSAARADAASCLQTSSSCWRASPRPSSFSSWSSTRWACPFFPCPRSSLTLKTPYQAMTFNESIKAIDTCRVYHSGPEYFVEVDIVMDGAMPLWQAHDIAQDLQDQIEALPDVDRCFVHIDHEVEHKPVSGSSVAVQAGRRQPNMRTHFRSTASTPKRRDPQTQMLMSPAID